MSPRTVQAEAITNAVAELCVRANCDIPPDIVAAVERAREAERSPIGRDILSDILENNALARAERLPACQDTGLCVIFGDVGQDVHIEGGAFEEALNAGVRRGYLEGGLRCSVVRDPLVRENTGDNTPAVIHVRIVPGDRLRITVAPKGFGSENMSAARMFNPTAKAEEIEEFIAETAIRAGSNPCPPIIVGVGLGGTFESAAIAAKRALLRPLGGENPEPLYRDMERRVLGKINASCVGPQGFGGDTTALGVCIAPQATHIAGLPCAVNIGCHVTRHAEMTL